MTPEQALNRLIAGNARYVAGTTQQTGVTKALRTELCEQGQKPYVAVVSCSDSRVPVELVFDTGPGELFVIRTAGNVVGSLEMGSLEYGIKHLKVPLVVVLGHQKCGAVKAAVDGGEHSSDIESILQEIRPAIPSSFVGDLYAESEDANARHVVSKITGNPNIQAACTEGAVRFVAAKYSLETGKVSFFE